MWKKVTLRVPLSVLQAKQNDLITLLRLGAGMNAIDSSSRLLVKTGPGGPEVDHLSRAHCVCTGLAYWGELVKTIKNCEFLDRLIELAAKGLAFSPVPVSLTEGRELLSPDHPDANPLLKVRDKVAFHWDPEPFRSYLLKSPDRALDLWTVSGEPLDRTFFAAADAIAQFTFDLPSDGRTAEDFMNLFLQAVTLVGHVLESAFIGLLVEAGEMQPKKFFVMEA